MLEVKKKDMFFKWIMVISVKERLTLLKTEREHQEVNGKTNKSISHNQNQCVHEPELFKNVNFFLPSNGDSSWPEHFITGLVFPLGLCFLAIAVQH